MTSVDPKPSILAAALAAYDAGLCVIRAKTDGTKAPLGKWEQYQHDRPSRGAVQAWFTNGHPGLGVICGNVSGDLEMFELEGLFMRENGAEFKRRVDAAGLALLFQRLINGFQMESPKGGRNFLYRVDGPVDGNTKLARRPATPEELAENPSDKVKTLIETRGEGGFVVLAPSHGPTHPSGKPWKVREGSYAGIPTITSEEREALFAVARSFDEAPTTPPPAPTPARRTTPQAWTGQPVGDSWFDAVVDHLKATVDMQTLLERHGWTYCYTDNRGRKLLRRPGKDEGVSGSINERGRFCPFSTSVPFASGGGGPMAPTYDQLDVIAVYEHSGDRKAAARHIAETTGILDTWKRTQDAASSNLTFIAPANIDPATGERAARTNLDDQFWNARPIHRHIRQAAHSRARSADAVLLFTLARIAAIIPPNFKLPPIVGGAASLNFLGATIGTSGAGKSTAGAVARELAPIDRTDVIADMPLGSGEGLTELYFEMVREEQPDGKYRDVKRQTKRGMYLYLDEGQALAEMGNRKGATLLPTLRSAWSGETIGQSNATKETFRVLHPHTYRMAVIVGFQAEYAAGLLSDAAGGTPQRFVYASAIDPNVPNQPAGWPGPIDMRPPDITGGEQIIDVDDTIANEIWTRNVLATRGEINLPPLDSHRDLVRLKVAALLAYLDQRRLHIGVDDWELAGDVMDVSTAVRDWVAEIARQKAAREADARNMAAAHREVVIATTVEQKALQSAARSVGKKVHKVARVVKRSEIGHAIAGKHKALVAIDDVIAEAEREGWIEAVGEGEWRPGRHEPA